MQRGCVTSFCPAYRYAYIMSAHTHIDSAAYITGVCGVYVLQKRHVLEEAEMLDPRISALEEDLDEVESSEEEDEEEEKVITCENWFVVK